MLELFTGRLSIKFKFIIFNGFVGILAISYKDEYNFVASKLTINTFTYIHVCANKQTFEG